jgi:hypothetical protein
MSANPKPITTANATAIFFIFFSPASLDKKWGVKWVVCDPNQVCWLEAGLKLA